MSSEVRPKWAGVDVGGRRKGFHVAIIDSEGVDGLAALQTSYAVSSWLAEQRPRIVAVDCPLTPAPEGTTSRPCERDLALAGRLDVRRGRIRDSRAYPSRACRRA